MRFRLKVGGNRGQQLPYMGLGRHAGYHLLHQVQLLTDPAYGVVELKRGAFRGLLFRGGHHCEEPQQNRCHNARNSHDRSLNQRHGRKPPVSGAGRCRAIVVLRQLLVRLVGRCVTPGLLSTQLHSPSCTAVRPSRQ